MLGEDLQSKYSIESTSEELWEVLSQLEQSKIELADKYHQSEKFNAFQLSNFEKYLQRDKGKPGEQNWRSQINLHQFRVNTARDQFRRSTAEFDEKIRFINQLLEEKKVADQRAIEATVETVSKDLSHFRLETAANFDAVAAQFQKQQSQLDNALAEHRAEINAKLQAIEHTVAQQQQWTEDLYGQFYSLKSDQQLLMEEYHRKQRDLNEKKYIEVDEGLCEFYRTVISKLVEVFVACKSLNSGMVVRDNYSQADKVAKYIALAGDHIPLPGASAVVGWIAKGAQFYADKVEGDRIATVSSLTTTTGEIDQLSEGIARGFTFKYEEQIRALPLPSCRLFGECIVQYTLRYLWGASGNDHHPSPSSSGDFITDILEGVHFVQFKSGLFNLTTHKIPCRIPGVTWSDEGIIKHCGIRTSSGRHWAGGEAKALKYGYCLARKELAQKLVMYKEPGRSPSRVLYLSEKQLARAI
ncbi:uncharacterized protein BJ171DRAFT_590272 [Polychytrium aggregatum]|uniref:uncharacterized protein n=1 Tax=Polychytrium aggregatum TaxID=110093 RepID=UPI0022FEBB33|nr:uncharacterized protein BJ171DRAFT_590272 [Polychytrium aggregatum]KAI9192912.1 hypothetical protein BJ171DRAFT_590272 [Polychytrium aggregatum]